MSLGEILRQRRTELGLTLRETAQRLAVDPAYLSRVEAGKVGLPVVLEQKQAIRPG